MRQECGPNIGGDGTKRGSDAYTHRAGRPGVGDFGRAPANVPRGEEEVPPSKPRPLRDDKGPMERLFGAALTREQRRWPTLRREQRAEGCGSAGMARARMASADGEVAE